MIEDIGADLNTFVGIEVDGTGNIVRNNQVVTTGASTTFGANASVRHNQVGQIGGSTTFGTNANAVGIVVLGHGAGSLAPNQLLDNSVSAIVKQGSGTSWGIFFASETTSKAVNNQITGAARGIDYSGGTDAGNNN